jgi:hypothetical protein
MIYSQITDGLFIGRPPSEGDDDMLRRLGVRLVICMRFWRRPHAARDPSLHYLWLRTLDSPLLPIPVRVLVQGATAALEVMEAGGKVYTYCARGRHRSVAMGAAILIAQGLSAEQAMTLIKERRAAADPEAFYIRRRIHLFAQRWSDLHANQRSATPSIGPVPDDMRSPMPSNTLQDSASKSPN